MANVKINQLPLATTPLTGTEVFPLVQGTTTKQVSVANLFTDPVMVNPTLGTVGQADLINATGLPISTGVAGLGTGIATFLGTPSSANLRAAVTDETGTGALVFANAPVLVAPDLGTPTFLVATNATGTALGLIAGSAVTNANLTGAVTSVGNATSLGSFTSAQLRTALTDETGSGVAVFATSPTLVTPVLGTPQSGDFSTGTFTWPTFNQNTTGTAAGLSATLAIASGGTAATTAASAIENLLPAYAGNGSKGLRLNSGATALEWVADGGGTVTSVAATVPSFLSIAGSPITTSGTLAFTLSGTALPTTSGGTGLTSFTSGGVVYASSTSALATGSALTFDGTNLGVTGTTATIKNTLTATTASVYSQYANTGGTLYIGKENSAGSSFGSTAYATVFYDTGNNPMVFFTSSSERMRLNSTGLGIGTSSPANKLQVEVSSADVEAVLFNNSYTVASARTALRMGYQVAGYGVRIVSEGNAGAAYSNSLVFERGIGSSSYSETMRINASGNVGIGTSSPATKLELSSTTGPTLRLSNSAGGQTTGDLIGALDYYSADADNPAVRSYIRSYVAEVSGRDSYLAFATTAIGGNAIERVRIDPAGAVGIGYTSLTSVGNNGLAVLGSVGIGTSSPATKLEVSSTTGPTLRLSNSAGGQTTGDLIGALDYYSADADNPAVRSYIRSYVAEVFGRDSYLSFATSAVGGNALERMRLNSVGNLGLGVTPSAWSVGKGFEVGFLGNGVFSPSQGVTNIVNNTYYASSSYRYATTAAAAYYSVNSGLHQWYTAASGTAGNTISFTQAMTLDADGNLMVGTTTSPYSTSGRAVITLNDSTSVIYALQTGGTNRGYIYADGTSIDMVAESTNDLKLTTKGSKFISFSTNNTERARINAAGDLLIGTTSATSSGYIQLIGSGTKYGIVNKAQNAGTANYPCGFFNTSATLVGSISSNDTATTYATSSDYRLKNTITPMTGALAKVAQLKPVTYKWNADGSDGEGFIAHELAEVVPQCVTGEKDAVDEDGNPKYQGIDTSFLVATLTAAIQEQQAIIESLKARLDAANL